VPPSDRPSVSLFIVVHQQQKTPLADQCISTGFDAQQKREVLELLIWQNGSTKRVSETASDTQHNTLSPKQRAGGCGMLCLGQPRNLCAAIHTQLTTAPTAPIQTGVLPNQIQTQKSKSRDCPAPPTHTTGWLRINFKGQRGWQAQGTTPSEAGAISSNTPAGAQAGGGMTSLASLLALLLDPQRPYVKVARSAPTRNRRPSQSPTNQPSSTPRILPSTHPTGTDRCRPPPTPPSSAVAPKLSVVLDGGHQPPQSGGGGGDPGPVHPQVVEGVDEGVELVGGEGLHDLPVLKEGLRMRKQALVPVALGAAAAAVVVVVVLAAWFAG